VKGKIVEAITNSPPKAIGSFAVANPKTRRKIMKMQTQIKVGVVISMILLSVTVAHAQSANQRFTATIPFEFNVGEQTLPAGDYEIAIANPSSDQRVLRIRSTKGTQNVMLTTHMVSSESTNAAKLVFRGYGEHHFLAQAWTGVDQNGLETPKSKAEKRYSNEFPAAQRRMHAVSLNRSR